ncbi:MAG: hypothetical protein F4103_12795 [Boseongicola sp. SB0673_bin_14]|nr:hypothetical protein [Boseongicola sp. SB0673_bin_14]
MSRLMGTKPGRTADRDGWQAAASGRFHEDVARFRADLAGQLAERDSAFANPRAARAERNEWPAMLLANTPMQMAFILAASFGATVAVVMLLGTFGSAIATALMASGPLH